MTDESLPEPVLDIIEAARELLKPGGDSQIAIHEHRIDATKKLKQAVDAFDSLNKRESK